MYMYVSPSGTIAKIAGVKWGVERGRIGQHVAVKGSTIDHSKVSP